MKPSWVLVALALLAFAPRPARADADADAFKDHVQKAKVHYDLGEYEDAAIEYTEAYRIRPVAGALFNIAQAYRQAGKYEQARQFYRSYLREGHPEGKSKATVEKAIRELDELIAKETRAKASEPNGVQSSLEPPSPQGHAAAPAPKSDSASLEPALQPPPPQIPMAPPPPQAEVTLSPPLVQSTPPIPPPARPKVAVAEPAKKVAPAAALAPPVTTLQARPQPSRKSHLWAYVTGGAAVALLAGGAVFTVQANNTDSEITGSDHPRAAVDSLINTSKSDHAIGAVLLGVGAAAAVGAGLLYFLPASGPSGGGGAAVGGHF